MDKNLGGLVDTVKSLLNFDMVGRAFFLGSIAASVALGIGLFNWVQSPIYTPLPYFVDDNNLATVVQELDKSHIQYQVNEYNHTVSVPVNALDKAKLSLSLAGVGKDNIFSLSYLNESNQFGTSQFIENARYVHALEADLARTISDIQGVNAAKVHLAIPQRTIFSDESAKPSASVVVNFTPGYEKDREKVKAIMQLIAASVPGLEPSSVVITNQYGQYLSSTLNQDSILNQEQLDYQNSLQTYYEKRIASLISPMMGVDKLSISVNVDLDFTHQEEAKEEYDPTKSTLRSEESIKESTTSASASGVPGSMSNTAPSSGQGQGSGSQGGNQQSGQNKDQSIKNYEVSKSMQYVKTTTPKIRSISVAIIVDNDQIYNPKTKKTTPQALTKAKIDQITELAKSTIGFNSKRGDRVTVVNSGFQAEKISGDLKTPLWERPWFYQWAKQLVGILLGFVFLFVLYKKYIATFKTKGQKNLPMVVSGAAGDQITPEMMQLKEEQIKVLQDLVARDPNKVATIIKKWIAN